MLGNRHRLPGQCGLLHFYAVALYNAGVHGDSVAGLQHDDVAHTRSSLFMDTGMQTEMGKIVDAIMQAEEDQTPLQKKLASPSSFREAWRKKESRYEKKISAFYTVYFTGRLFC